MGRITGITLNYIYLQNLNLFDHVLDNQKQLQNHNPLKQNLQNKLELQLFHLKDLWQIILVLKPIFSAFAIDSSVVPVFEHSSLNLIKFLSSLKNSEIG